MEEEGENLQLLYLLYSSVVSLPSSKKPGILKKSESTGVSQEKWATVGSQLQEQLWSLVKWRWPYHPKHSGLQEGKNMFM